MTRMKALLLASVFAGGVAATPAAAQEITWQDVVIPGLLVASGILLYDEIANGDVDDWDDDYYGRRPRQLDLGDEFPWRRGFDNRDRPLGWQIGQGHRKAHGHGHRRHRHFDD